MRATRLQQHLVQLERCLCDRRDLVDSLQQLETDVDLPSARYCLLHIRSGERSRRGRHQRARRTAAHACTAMWSCRAASSGLVLCTRSLCRHARVGAPCLHHCSETADVGRHPSPPHGIKKLNCILPLARALKRSDCRVVWRRVRAYTLTLHTPQKLQSLARAVRLCNRKGAVSAG